MAVSELSRVPAVLVFRARGRLLFANPTARFLLDSRALEAEDLQALCIQLFPGVKDYDRAAHVLRHALSDEGLGAGTCFQARYATRDGQEHEGIFHVVSWRERDGEPRAMLSCLPAERPETALAPVRPAQALESMDDLMERIQDLLDVALTVGRVGSDRWNGPGTANQGLVERLEMARDLLSSVAQSA